MHLNILCFLEMWFFLRGQFEYMKNNGLIQYNFRFIYKLRYQKVKWNVGNSSNTQSAC